MLEREHMAHAVIVAHTGAGTPVYAAECGLCHWRGPRRRQQVNLADLDAKRHEREGG